VLYPQLGVISTVRRGYAIYIPKNVKKKVGKIAGKEIIVIVILLDDAE